MRSIFRFKKNLKSVFDQVFSLSVYSWVRFRKQPLCLHLVLFIVRLSCPYSVQVCSGCWTYWKTLLSWWRQFGFSCHMSPMRGSCTSSSICGGWGWTRGLGMLNPWWCWILDRFLSLSLSDLQTSRESFFCDIKNSLFWWTTWASTWIP